MLSQRAPCWSGAFGINYFRQVQVGLIRLVPPQVWGSATDYVFKHGYLISVCRAAKLSPKPLLAGSELPTALSPLLAALRLFLLGSLLLAPRPLRFPDLRLTRRLLLASSSQPEVPVLLELLKLLIEGRRAL